MRLMAIVAVAVALGERPAAAQTPPIFEVGNASNRCGEPVQAQVTVHNTGNETLSGTLVGRVLVSGPQAVRTQTIAVAPHSTNARVLYTFGIANDCVHGLHDLEISFVPKQGKTQTAHLAPKTFGATFDVDDVGVEKAWVNGVCDQPNADVTARLMPSTLATHIRASFNGTAVDWGVEPGPAQKLTFVAPSPVACGTGIPALMLTRDGSKPLRLPIDELVYGE